MCGICGIYQYKTGAPVNQDLLERMMRRIEHRGPDDSGSWREGGVGLGMRRLSIIDLEGGHQPIANETGSCRIVFNGEIYNFRELRRELEQAGHRFQTRSDTEVIIHAYEQWGVDALKRLNGMFGLAIWDSAKRELLLARDHFGVKPLYYYVDGKRLLFGSELKSILADVSVPRAVDETALAQYLTFRFTPSPRTLMAGISKLPPGHYLVCGEEGIRLGRYFTEVPARPQPRAEAELVEELSRLLDQAITRQMVSDVPVGALLSGGVDSNTVVARMQAASPVPIYTFTVGFTDQGRFNEMEYARQSAERLGTNHHEVLLSSKDFAGFLPKAMWHLEEPVVTPSILPMYFVSRLAREHVKVVLTGQGADEPWAGYRRYEGEAFAALYQALPAALRQKLVAPLVEALPRLEVLKRAARSLGESDPAERFTQVYAVFTEDQKNLLYRNNGIQQRCRESESVRYWLDEVRHLDSLSQMTYVDARFSLPDDLLLYGDKMAMASSLEARVPMLDLDLMSFVESLPSNLRLRGRRHKYLYRKAIAKWLPAEILTRPKLGFETPMDQWLSGNLSSYASELLFSPGSACQTYFHVPFVRKMLDQHIKGRYDYRRQIFCLISFEIWYRLFIDGQPVESVPS